jgi:Transposase DDE domain group 1
MTECNQRAFRFESQGRREIVAQFDGGTISSDGGAVLLAEIERRTRIVERFANCFVDRRDPSRIEHSVRELAMQRVLGLCLGYEDITDHDALRNDPLLSTLAGKRDPTTALAGKSTLSRLELSTSEADRYKKLALDTAAVDRLLVDVFLESPASAPKSIVIDLDATDFPIHGEQEGRFFHGYYDHHCYLPLYIFAGEHLLRARMRRSNIDACAGTLDELAPIVEQIRAAWPSVKILIRADSGFCREEIMAWCEANAVDFVLGLARNERLVEMVQYQLGMAQCAFAASLKSERVYGELEYRTLDTWSRARRVVTRAEHSRHGDNPRFVVTSLSKAEIDAQRLYEDVYCARGDMENRIKEQQLDLFADRVSAATMRANQVRLYFASIAYTLMHALRRIGLAGTQLERAQCGTIRLRLLKIGAQIRVSVRRVRLALSQAFPMQDLFAHVLANVRAGPVAGV